MILCQEIKMSFKIRLIIILILSLSFFAVYINNLPTAKSYVFVTQWGSRGNGDGQFASDAPPTWFKITDETIEKLKKIRWYTITSEKREKLPEQIDKTRIASCELLPMPEEYFRKKLLDANFTPEEIKIIMKVMENKMEDEILEALKTIKDGEMGEDGLSCALSGIGIYDFAHIHLISQEAALDKPSPLYSNGPSYIAANQSGDIYVADCDNNRIQKFDTNGKFLCKWGSKGRGYGQFISPYGVAVDKAGDVYVTDPGNHRVQKFDSNGNFLCTWGKYGEGDGEFIGGPGEIAIDPRGYVYEIGRAHV